MKEKIQIRAKKQVKKSAYEWVINTMCNVCLCVREFLGEFVLLCCGKFSTKNN
jgi:hypothetical protein